MTMLCMRLTRESFTRLHSQRIIWNRKFANKYKLATLKCDNLLCADCSEACRRINRIQLRLEAKQEWDKQWGRQSKQQRKKENTCISATINCYCNWFCNCFTRIQFEFNPCPGLHWFDLYYSRRNADNKHTRRTVVRNSISHSSLAVCS